MRLITLTLVVLVAGGCASSPPAGSRPPGSPSAPAPDRAVVSRIDAGPTLRRVHTGQTRPSVLVQNAFPTAQHVFIDWAHIGEIAPGASKSFVVEVGTHTLISAESADPDAHPVSVTERFERGYRYGYAIVPE